VYDVCGVRCDDVSAAVSSAAAHARAAIDDQERSLLEHLSTARHDRVRQLDNHIAAYDLQASRTHLPPLTIRPGFKAGGLEGPGPRPPTNRGPSIKPFIFYFPLLIDAYETTT